MKIELKTSEFLLISKAIHDICGINLQDSKKNLVESRLRKRVIALGFLSFKPYIEYLFSDDGMINELVPLIDLITTNKTDFFRENAHFEFLSQNALPEMMLDSKSALSLRYYNFWSAGCSTGEEPYTLAIVLKEFNTKNPGFRFRILASDISTDVLNKAAAGIFSEESVEIIPFPIKKKYFLKSKDPAKKVVKIAPEVQSLIEFSRINFIEIPYNVPYKMDVIFCRNVLIYFTRSTQEKVINSLCTHLNVGGYILLGHSETIQGLKLPLTRVASTIYQKTSRHAH